MRNITQTSYDDVGRTTQTVEAYGTISARTTQYLYTLDNLISQMIAKNPITGDQVTTWEFGTTLASSGVARSDLLASTIYPGLAWSTLTVQQWAMLTVDQWANLPVDPTDVTNLTYNRLGEPGTFADQRRNVRTFTRDLLGRQTDDGVTTVGSNTDSAVLRISRAYEIRGMIATITSADNATPGAGTVVNQVAFAYNDFGQPITDQQEHNGAVTAGTPSVQYAFDSAASGSNEIRLNQLTYPNGRTIAPGYGMSGGMSDYLNRVDAINDTTSGATTLALYLYLGLGTPIRIAYPEPGIWLDLWGGISGTFNGFDLFGRIIDQRWQNNISGTPVAIDQYQYGYDQNSNRLYKANVVGTAAVSSGLDEHYTYDPLNRVTDMQRGVLNSTNTGITGTPSVEQGWTLDATGNWAGFVTNASGTATLNQTRTANTVNEITNITESTGPTWIVPAYDAAGNTITMPQVVDPTQYFTAVYDAWNRMVSISAGTTAVGKYQYDGRNFRIVKLTYTGGTLTETRDFYFTANWQDIEEDVSGSMVDQYVWGLRYIDELVCRDDATPQRLYAAQDANFNLTSIANTSGAPVERYLFDPYGDRTIMDASWSVIGSSGYDWIVGHQGLIVDARTHLVSNRLRDGHLLIGRFIERDVLGYADGSNLYEYLRGNPIAALDPQGTFVIGGGFSAGATAMLVPIGPGLVVGAQLSLSLGEFYGRDKRGWFCETCVSATITGLAGVGANVSAGLNPWVAFGPGRRPGSGPGFTVGIGAGSNLPPPAIAFSLQGSLDYNLSTHMSTITLPGLTAGATYQISLRFSGKCSGCAPTYFGFSTAKSNAMWNTIFTGLKSCVTTAVTNVISALNSLNGKGKPANGNSFEIQGAPPRP